LTSALDGGGVVSFTPRPIYPQGESPRYLLDGRGSVGPRKRMISV